MRRWHNEETLMDRQRRMDLADHRESAMRGGYDWEKRQEILPDPDAFECVCKHGKGMFRKHKQWACSCYHCRAETAYRRLETKAERRREKVELSKNVEAA